MTDQPTIIAVSGGLQLTDNGKVYLQPLRCGSQLGLGPMEMSDKLRDCWFGLGDYAELRELEAQFNQAAMEALALYIDKRIKVWSKMEAPNDT